MSSFDNETGTTGAIYRFDPCTPEFKSLELNSAPLQDDVFALETPSHPKVSWCKSFREFCNSCVNTTGIENFCGKFDCGNNGRSLECKFAENTCFEIVWCPCCNLNLFPKHIFFFVFDLRST